MARRLQKDRAGDRSVGRLRLVAAALSAIAVVWVVVTSGAAWWAFAVAAVVAIAARFWIVSWARIERAPAPDLVLDERELRLGDRALPWSEIEGIELDQDRMVVRVLAGPGTVEIEPPYGGLGLDALGAEIDRARRQARGR